MNPERLWTSNGFARFQPRRRARLVALYVLAWIGVISCLWWVSEAIR